MTAKAVIRKSGLAKSVACEALEGSRAVISPNTLGTTGMPINDDHIQVVVCIDIRQDKLQVRNEVLPPRGFASIEFTRRVTPQMIPRGKNRGNPPTSRPQFQIRYQPVHFGSQRKGVCPNFDGHRARACPFGSTARQGRQRANQKEACRGDNARRNDCPYSLRKEHHSAARSWMGKPQHFQ